MNNASFIIVLIFVTSIWACNNDSNTPSSNAVPEIKFDGDVVTKELSNGSVLYTVSKGNVLKEEGIILKGKKNGPWTVYYEKGMVESISNYEDGILQGPTVKINNYGNLIERSFYINGKLSGKRIKYNRQNIKQEENYVNGILNGKRSLFYDNGKIQEEGNFVNGKRDGMQKWYDQEGKVTIEYNYENGKKISE